MRLLNVFYIDKSEQNMATVVKLTKTNYPTMLIQYNTIIYIDITN